MKGFSTAVAGGFCPQSLSPPCPDTSSLWAVHLAGCVGECSPRAPEGSTAAQALEVQQNPKRKPGFPLCHGCLPIFQWHNSKGQAAAVIVARERFG